MITSDDLVRAADHVKDRHLEVVCAELGIEENGAKAAVLGLLKEHSEFQGLGAIMLMVGIKAGMGEADRLRAGIQEHRRLIMMREEGRRISSVVADRDLWAVLEELT